MNQPIVQTFKRYEKKYRLTTAQRAEFIRRVQPFMRPDDYGTYTIGSLYLDTPDFRLIRASLENRSIRKSCGYAATACLRRRTRCSWS